MQEWQKQDSLSLRCSLPSLILIQRHPPFPLIYSFIYYSIYMLHYLKFFHRKKVLKRPQFYYYKLIESYGYMCMYMYSSINQGTSWSLSGETTHFCFNQFKASKSLANPWELELLKLGPKLCSNVPF